MPVFMTQRLSASALVELVSAVLYVLIGRFLDPRWKVVVSSKPMRRATMFHAVQVEFLESGEAAAARQAGGHRSSVASQPIHESHSDDIARTQPRTARNAPRATSAVRACPRGIRPDSHASPVPSCNRDGLGGHGAPCTWPAPGSALTCDQLHGRRVWACLARLRRRPVDGRAGHTFEARQIADQPGDMAQPADLTEPR